MIKRDRKSFEKCYAELSELWGKYPIADDYRKTLQKEPGYEKWEDSENIDIFMSDNYSFVEKQDGIIAKYYGEEWDVTSEFPEWCRRYFGGYYYDDFAVQEEEE